MSADLESSCAEVYSSDLVRFLLGESFHPGGAALTARLAAFLEVGAGQTVVDVASGLGTSAMQVAEETDCEVVGVDLSAVNVGEAQRRAAGRVRFVQGNSERLPFPDASLDGALCECSFCLFPDRAATAAEVVRVLRPGARLALSDVVAEPARLPPELRTAVAEVACLARACPLEDLTDVLERVGLQVELTERHDEALRELIEQVGERLRAFELDGHALLSAAGSAVQDGTLGYGIVVARKP